MIVLVEKAPHPITPEAVVRDLSARELMRRGRHTYLGNRARRSSNGSTACGRKSLDAARQE